MAYACRILLTSGVGSVRRFDLLVIWVHGKYSKNFAFSVLGLLLRRGSISCRFFEICSLFFGFFFFVLVLVLLSIFGGVFPPGSDI